MSGCIKAKPKAAPMKGAVHGDATITDKVPVRKELTKHKAVACDNEGYDKYFILDGKKMAVENFDMSGAEVKRGTPSELKRIFGKSMANRLVSRVVLNKFIQEVA